MALSASIFVAIYIMLISVTSFVMIRNTKRLKDDKRRFYKEEISDDMEFYKGFPDEIRYKYYQFVRDEVKREDEITHQRLTWAINFHAFLINAFAFVLVFGWKENPPDIEATRRIAIVGIGLIGLTFSFASLLGVVASRRSIDDTRERWNAVNRAWDGFYPKYVPQTFGQDKAFFWGRFSAILMPIGLILLWGILTVGHLIVYIFRH